MTKIKLSFGIAIMAMSSLTSCGGDDQNTPAVPTTPTTSINVTNTDGGTSDITGTWVTACFTAFGPAGLDGTNSETFNDSSYTLIDTEYATSDGSCGGATTEIGRKTASFTIGLDVASTLGWEDATTGTAVAAPVAQDGITTLPATPTATELLTTNVVSSGTFAGANTTGTVRRIVDASVATNMAIYDLYSPSTGNLVADTFYKATKQ